MYALAVGRKPTGNKEVFLARLAKLAGRNSARREVSPVEEAVASIVSGWSTARRNDTYVAEVVRRTHAMDDVIPLNLSAYFDELFYFVREIGAWGLLEALDPGSRKGEIYPFLQFVLFTIMRCVSGVESMLAAHDVLLTDEAAMGLLGFNAAQVRDGVNGRGVSRRKNPVEVRGPFSFETAADNIVKIAPKRLEALFNGVIRCLAAKHVFPKHIDALLDSTDDEATRKYGTDDGRPVPKVTKEKRPDVRDNRHAQKIKVTVYGWKVWVVWEPVSRIPLAIAIDGINEPENKRAWEVLQQARKNVKGYGKIRSVALDRGYLDGKLLSLIDKADIKVYIPAKSGMTITADAREIAHRAASLAASGKKLDSCRYAERVEEVGRSSGKKAMVERRLTALMGVRDLPCDWWKEDGKTSADNSKKFQPKLVNASVVLRWDGAPADAEKEVVILTNDPSEDPFVAFDAYDDRSLIENTCNREAKEGWFLEHHPKRSEAGVRVQAYFVFTCMALVTAFRMYRDKAEETESRGRQTGIGRYRRGLEARNRDKVIVFCGEHFGIFRNFELLELCGVKVHLRADGAMVVAPWGGAAGAKRGDTS